MEVKLSRDRFLRTNLWQLTDGDMFCFCTGGEVTNDIWMKVSDTDISCDGLSYDVPASYCLCIHAKDGDLELRPENEMVYPVGTIEVTYIHDNVASENSSKNY